MYEKDEIRRLRKENRKLKKRVALLEKENRISPDSEPSASSYSASNYFAYLFSRIREKSFYAAIQKYLKPSLWVSRIFLWGLTAYKYVQAGAFVLLYTAAFILIIPVLLVITALTLITTLVLRNRNARKLLASLGDDVVFIIPDGKDGFDGDFIRKKCEEYPMATVLIVSPFFLGKTGIYNGQKMYVCYRKERENVFILRNYFFFYFRKKLKKSHSKDFIEIRLFGDKEI